VTSPPNPYHTNHELTPEHKVLIGYLKGSPRGLTRVELSHRLALGDRTVRALIEDLVSAGILPVIADRTGGGEARYRIARVDEPDLVHREREELESRALSLHKRSKGLLTAYQTFHGAGELFS
jgi:hypothetical protein